MTTEKQTRFLWLDVETTGLNPDSDLLLEVAWWPTRSAHPLDLRESDQKTSVIYVPGETLGGKLSPVTWEMHGKSGLLAAIARASKTSDSSDSVARVLLGQMHNIDGWRETNWHLAGNSVHFDRGFIRAQSKVLASWQDVERALHHRILDVSSLKLAAVAMGYEEPKGEPAHRALDDVKASVAQYRRIVEWMSRRNGLGVEPPTAVATGPTPGYGG